MPPLKHVTSFQARVDPAGASSLGFSSCSGDDSIYVSLCMRKQPGLAVFPVLMMMPSETSAGSPAGVALTPFSILELSFSVDANSLRVTFEPPCQARSTTEAVTIVLSVEPGTAPMLSCVLEAFKQCWEKDGTAANMAGKGDDKEGEGDEDDAAAALGEATPKGLAPAIGPYVSGGSAVWPTT